MAYLGSEDKESMLEDLLKAIEICRHDNSFDAIEQCLASWEATVELNSIPGVKEKVTERHTRLKRAGVIHGRKVDN